MYHLLCVLKGFFLGWIEVFKCLLNGNFYLQNEWVKAKRELEAKREIIELLKLECEETRQSVTRQVEEREQELADALAAAAESRSAAAEVFVGVSVILLICYFQFVSQMYLVLDELTQKKIK